MERICSDGRGAGTVTLAGPVLVTGAAGLVGRAVVARLGLAGLSVIPVVRTGPTPADGLVTDLRLCSVADILRRLPAAPSAIVHLAAAVPHWARYADTPVSADATKAMDRTIVELSSRTQAPLIYASTCGLYDPADASWKTEAYPVLPRTPYFHAKLEGERLAAGVDAAILRLSAPYGPGLPPALVLNRFMDQARQGETLQVWGAGSREQDFIAVGDIARAVLSCLIRRQGGVFNIAAGRPISMIELARLVIKAVGGGDVLVGAAPDPAEGHSARYAVIKAARDLDWAPQEDLGDWLSRQRGAPRL